MRRWLPKWLRVWLEVPAAIGAGFRALLDRFETLALQVHDAIDAFVGRPPVVFVTLLISAKTPDGIPIVWGETKWLAPGEKEMIVSHQALFPFVDPMVCVLTDLSRVEVGGIYVGVNLIGMGQPYAVSKKPVEPGVMIRVQIRRPQ